MTSLMILPSFSFCFEHLMKYTLISMSIQHGLAITGNHEHLHEKLMSHLTGRECALAENVNRVGCMALMHWFLVDEVIEHLLQLQLQVLSDVQPCIALCSLQCLLCLHGIFFDEGASLNQHWHLMTILIDWLHSCLPFHTHTPPLVGLSLSCRSWNWSCCAISNIRYLQVCVSCNYKVSVNSCIDVPVEDIDIELLKQPD